MRKLSLFSAVLLSSMFLWATQVPQDYLGELNGAKSHQFNLNQIRSFVYYWYSLHDRHADINKTYELLDKDNLLMKFPEQEVRTFDDYRKWYDNVGKNIASNIHDVKTLNVKYLPDHQYQVNLVVDWRAVGTDGKFIDFDATQKWILTDSTTPALNHPLVRQYIVEKFEPATGPGSLVKYQLYKNYSVKALEEFQSGELAKLLSESQKKNLASLGGFKNGIKTYLVKYLTTNYDGTTVEVSGIVVIPEDSGNGYPLVSFQHGTVIERSECPSYLEKCHEAELAALIFGARGYVVCMSDYIGQGKSELDHPYLDPATEASSCLDMIRATQELCSKLGVKLKPELFITGYSQGGQSTLALQKLIETTSPEGVKLTASAPASGPYNALDSWKHLVEKPCVLSSGVAGWWALAYDDIYRNKMPLNEIFRSPYDSTVPILLDGYHDGGYVIGNLPQDPKDMFRKDFIEDTLSLKNAFGRELKANDLTAWAPKVPTRLYYSSADEAVSPDSVEAAYKSLKEHGASDIGLVEKGEGLQHSGAFVPIMVDIKKWFDGFQEAK